MANFKSNGEFIRTRQIRYFTTKAIFQERELIYEGSVAKNATVQTEGNRQIIRDVEFYNLNVIISGGFSLLF